MKQTISTPRLKKNKIRNNQSSFLEMYSHCFAVEAARTESVRLSRSVLVCLCWSVSVCLSRSICLGRSVCLGLSVSVGLRRGKHTGCQ